MAEDPRARKVAREALVRRVVPGADRAVARDWREGLAANVGGEVAGAGEVGNDNVPATWRQRGWGVGGRATCRQRR